MRYSVLILFCLLMFVMACKVRQPLGEDTRYPKAYKVFVKGGKFMMGNRDTTLGGPDEYPQHLVKVNDFYIGKYEVTNAQYATFLNHQGNQTVEGVPWVNIESEDCQIEQLIDGSYEPEIGKGHYPVVDVTWHGAKAFATWAGGRLPTEAEWEYAARGGRKAKETLYAGSNNIHDVAWFYKSPENEVHKVGLKQANELGLYDMTGNVWEWCEDWYVKEYYKESPQNNPVCDIDSSGYHLLRGGSWNYYAYYCRLTFRNRYHDNHGYKYYGFRLVFDTER